MTDSRERIDPRYDPRFQRGYVGGEADAPPPRRVADAHVARGRARAGHAASRASGSRPAPTRVRAEAERDRQRREPRRVRRAERGRAGARAPWPPRPSPPRARPPTRPDLERRSARGVRRGSRGSQLADRRLGGHGRGRRPRRVDVMDRELRLGPVLRTDRSVHRDPAYARLVALAGAADGRRARRGRRDRPRRPPPARGVRRRDADTAAAAGGFRARRRGGRCSRSPRSGSC